MQQGHSIQFASPQQPASSRAAAQDTGASIGLGFSDALNAMRHPRQTIREMRGRRSHATLRSGSRERSQQRSGGLRRTISNVNLAINNPFSRRLDHRSTPPLDEEPINESAISSPEIPARPALAAAQPAAGPAALPSAAVPPQSGPAEPAPAPAGVLAPSGPAARPSTTAQPAAPGAGRAESAQGTTRLRGRSSGQLPRVTTTNREARPSRPFLSGPKTYDYPPDEEKRKR